MEVPKEVLKAAADLVKRYGAKFKLLGKTEGRVVYSFDFPRDTYTGYPFLYLYGSGPVKEVTGEEALKLARSLGAE